MRVALVASTVGAWGCLDPSDFVHAPLPSAEPFSASVQTENARAGTLGWDAGLAAPVDSFVAGFVYPFSVRGGETIRFFVRSQDPTVTVRVLRLGWYGGIGARQVDSVRFTAGAPQPPCSPPLPGPVVCDWNASAELVTGREWPPGVYLATFTDSSGRRGGYPFVLRSGQADGYLLVLPFSTYEAYNDWGGVSLYKGPGGERGHAVSFARPLAHWDLWRSFLALDYLLIRWLEQQGYNAVYVTDFDFFVGRDVDFGVIAWLFAGHSEYWTWLGRLQLEAGRDYGVNLAFLGGNAVYWNSRYEETGVGSARIPTLVCYKNRLQDPQGSARGFSTVKFRDYPNNWPENEIIGVMSSAGLDVPNWPVDLVVADGSDSLFRGTGLTSGQRIPRLVGWEGDRMVANGFTPPGIRLLFDSPYVSGQTGAPDAIQGTYYEWRASGARVFASGNVGFQWGLATYAGRVAVPELSVFLSNVLADFAAERKLR